MAPNSKTKKTLVSNNLHRVIRKSSIILFLLTLLILSSLLILSKLATRSNFAQSSKVFLTKNYYSLFPDKLNSKLKKINMLEIAENNEQLSYWIKVLGSKKTMEELLNDSGSGYALDCHQQAHLIGRLSYQIYGASAFKNGSSSCHSGFYHGAMESFLSIQGTNNLAKKISDVCNNFKTSFTNFECLHGVGHGVLAYSSYDLPEAINLCKELEREFEKSSCFGGVFMENIITAQGAGAIPDHETDWVKNDDYHYPCTIFENDPTVNLQCYQMQTSWMLTLSGSNFEKVASECLKTTPQTMISTCFKSLGRDIAGNSLRVPEKIKDGCNKVPMEKDYYDSCIIGGLNVIVDFFGPDIKNQGTELCLIVPENSKPRCYSTLSSRLQGILVKPSDIEAICNGFEKEYRNYCRV